jgi:hypothetical protein
MQLLQLMLDIPSNKSIVSFADLAKFNVSVFGADEIINHLRQGGEAVAPTFPCDSIFVRKFKEVVLDESPASSLASGSSRSSAPSDHEDEEELP